MRHTPVLLNEVISQMSPRPNENFIDCTLGQAGHAREILKRIAPNGKLLGIDGNVDSIAELKKEFKNSHNIVLVNDNFANLENIYEHFFNYPVHGILFDLGLSTQLLEISGRGFSFMKPDEPLDMRFDREHQVLTAAEILNNYSFKTLAEIFKEFGEYPHTKLITEEIVQRRRQKKFECVGDLTEVVKKSHFYKGNDKINPATLIFQALRIAVNAELDNLVKALVQSFGILKSGGRLSVISFHSLEDRIVKNYYKSLEKDGLVKLTSKKPLTAGEYEKSINPRARSAKLRVAIKN